MSWGDLTWGHALLFIVLVLVLLPTRWDPAIGWKMRQMKRRKRNDRQPRR